MTRSPRPWLPEATRRLPFRRRVRNLLLLEAGRLGGQLGKKFRSKSLAETRSRNRRRRRYRDVDVELDQDQVSEGQSLCRRPRPGAPACAHMHLIRIQLLQQSILILMTLYGNRLPELLAESDVISCSSSSCACSDINHGVVYVHDTDRGACTEIHVLHSDHDDRYQILEWHWALQLLLLLDIRF